MGQATTPTPETARRVWRLLDIASAVLVVGIWFLWAFALPRFASLLAGTGQPAESFSAPWLVAATVLLAASVSVYVVLSRLRRRWAPLAFRRDVVPGAPPAVVTCPRCNTAIDVTAWGAGAKVRCGACNAVLRVPEAVA